MPGEFDHVAVAVLDDAFLGGAEESGQRVAHSDSRGRFEEFGKLHGRVLLGSEALAKPASRDYDSKHLLTIIQVHANHGYFEHSADDTPAAFEQR